MADPEGSGLYNKVSSGACADFYSCRRVPHYWSSVVLDPFHDRWEELYNRLQIRVGCNFWLLSYPHIPDHCNHTHRPLNPFFVSFSVHDCVVVGFGYSRIFSFFPRDFRSDTNGTFCSNSDLGGDAPVDRLSTESCSIGGRRRERRGGTKWILSLKECQC